MCDTFVVMPSVTVDGSLIFAKNSDREPNEAQCLEYYPGKEYRKGETVRCTYLEIPQVLKTHAILISRPFWMWGAEMGANEYGVVIGNEAVFTKMMVNKENALTGMDLLRLALERSKTAEQAVETITKLLFDFEQGGICGFEDKKMVYHNSYIIADPEEAWVLETAGPLWAALRIKKFYAISNGLTIGEKFDESHPELIQTARDKGWLKKGQTFHFARCYADWFYTTFSACKKRRKRATELLQNHQNYFDLLTAFAHLRDHGSEDYDPDSHFLGDRICAHAANKLSRNSMQTTASFVASLKRGRHTFWATGTSAPCTSIFKPIRFQNTALPSYLSNYSGEYNSDSYWWRHELFHRTVLLDFDERLNSFIQERDQIERELVKNAAENNNEKITEDAFQLADRKREEWFGLVKDLPVKHKPGLIYRRYWKSQNRKAGIKL